MKLSKARVAHLSKLLVERLTARGSLALTGPPQALAAVLEQTITDELMVEDRLNAEIRTLMKAYEREIESGQVDYQKMFTMIKSKLVRDRNLVL
ncbi:MAG: hypothetical protein A4S17_01370 [Proteobacteria bacterium HN_bin10]|nr:MAG: hypothetical protein A4S17_01370 [Proteobacteria bacterium HN_bin10]